MISGTPTTVGSTAFTVSAVDANGQSDSKAVTLLIALGPLVIVKTASVAMTIAGGTVGYTITITNTASTSWTGVSINDPLTGVPHEATYDANATASSGTLSYAASTLSWTGTIASGAVVTITYSVTVNSPETGDQVLVNTVTSTTLGTNCEVSSGDPRCSTAMPAAARSITLTGFASGFTLTGQSHSTVSLDNAAEMTVTTNSMGGYLVTVQAAQDTLVAAAPANTASIPNDHLRERNSGSSGFRSLSATTPFVVAQRNTASAPGGDVISNDYQVEIPFVPPATYSVTLNYIASAQ